MNNFVRFFATLLVIAGIVVEVNKTQIVVSYKKGKLTRHSKVSRDLSVCTPAVGQAVFFYKDYKIVECVDQQI
jgi:hypothetical protein